MRKEQNRFVCRERMKIRVGAEGKAIGMNREKHCEGKTQIHSALVGKNFVKSTHGGLIGLLCTCGALICC